MAKEYDFEDGDLRVTIKDSGVPSGGRYVAEIAMWKEGNQYPTFQYYEYGITKDEALENAKSWITVYRAEIR